jgi:hypothetical protein
MTEIENGTERMAAVISNRRLGSASSQGEKGEDDLAP